MPEKITNTQLVQVVQENHRKTAAVLDRLLTGSPPAGAELYAAATELRNLTRGAACAAQELKFRLKVKLNRQGAENAKV